MLKMDEDDADGFGHRNRHQMSSKIAKVLCIEITTIRPGRLTRTSRQLMHCQISPEDNFTLINLEVHQSCWLLLLLLLLLLLHAHTNMLHRMSSAEAVAFCLVSDSLSL